MAIGTGLRTAGTLMRLALRSAAKRMTAPQPDETKQGAAFRAAITGLAADPAVAGAIRRVQWVSLGADGSGWTETDLDVASGEEVTVLATGTLWASRALDLSFGPRIGLWLRIGPQGRIFKTPSDVSSVTIPDNGPLYIVAKPPGEWADEQGNFDPDFPRVGISGALEVCVIVWKGTALAGLEAMHQAVGSHEAVARALDEARHPVVVPNGWSYLWRLGDGRIYHDADGAQGRHIHCHTQQDVGILQFPADFPLTDTTHLQWRWKADRLPSDLPEDIQPTHDYLSIAVEFDNGQDLTYMWSGSLSEGTIFRCPLPYWDRVETHWVLRSNPHDLGKWLSEDRPVKADYARAVGTPPARIVRVWLIAVSVFQRGEGICDYADIELVDGETRLKIL